MSNIIVGSGVAIPDNLVSNHDLARIMDTSPEWISTRTGVEERRFVDPGVSTSRLAVEAVGAALQDAGVAPDEVGVLITATMTPDVYAPGIAGSVQKGAGLGPIPVFDLRQQCTGFIYGLDLAHRYLETGGAEVAVVVGAEVHSALLPWSDESWRALADPRLSVSPADFEWNTAHRSWSVLFGDGAGAVVLRRIDSSDGGILASVLITDGEGAELIWIPGVGSIKRPYVTRADLDEHAHVPVMDGPGLYRRAVSSMCDAVAEASARAGVDPKDIDLVVAHQANERILDGVRRKLGFGVERVPSNIARYGNTTAATLPILFHELRKSERVQPGYLVCFVAFGAGAHSGAVLYHAP
ncbi:MAG: 3-oxoacyl-[acyl-carrier-protein] synthase 3 [Acidimicrobiia bacterium]|nr:MAG: 3-oxoacyl-[acyl-carrier-protein] synthase 3 [Acidimicrobiia bacterium]